ncbi:MAG TPA: cytochrome c [Methylibium sp.]|nr:cytochrome c [Methylibium sp.]
MSLRSICLAAALALGAAAASAADAPFDLTDPARIAAGKLRFGSTCAAYCHGNEGSGGKAPAFKGRSDFVAADAYKVITEGRRGADIMPPWGNAFTPEEIWELVAYLQHLSTLPAP